MPEFTVIMATWNRGRHILPSVRSVLAQSHRDFELLVIGDDVTDDTAEHLSGIDDPRLRWINNAPRWGTQSGPNNRGIAEARAPFVAYIGHDDIWAPDHLAALNEVRLARPEADVIVSGLVGHHPDARRPYMVRGLLEPGAGQEARCFVPPSATAHRTGLARQHLWRRKEEADLPVDLDLQLRLVDAGAVHASTGRITVHKFSAAARYLSYFEPSTVEQEQVLRRLAEPGVAGWLAGIVDRARATGGYMPEQVFTRNGERMQKRVRVAAQVRGISGLPEPLPVGDGISLLQGDDPRGGDWLPLKPGSAWRVAGANPSPRLLVPLVGDEPVELRLRLRTHRPDLLPGIRVWLNGDPAPHRIETRRQRPRFTFADLVLHGALRPDRASVLVLERPGDEIATDGAGRVLAAGALTAVPLRTA